MRYAFQESRKKARAEMIEKVSVKLQVRRSFVVRVRVLYTRWYTWV